MGTDRTSEFLSLCMRCHVQQKKQQQFSGSGNELAVCPSSLSASSALAFVCEDAVPSPPFSFAPAAVAAAAAPAAAAADGSVVALLRCCFPIPPGTFAFLLLAARCAESQYAIEQQLHPLAALSPPGKEGQHHGREPVASAAAAADEVSRLLERVRRQQQQLQQLEQQTQSLDGVTELAKARLQWEQAEATRQRKLGVDRSVWRSMPSVAKDAARWRGGKGGAAADWQSAAIVHRRAIVGCLYASLQTLTEKLKKKEVTVLEAQVEQERYFSAYGFLRLSGKEEEREKKKQIRGDAAAAAAKTRKQPQTSAAWMRMQSQLAAAAAARAAEHVLAAQQHVKQSTEATMRSGIATAAAADGTCRSERTASASCFHSARATGDHSSTAAWRDRETLSPRLHRQQEQKPSSGATVAAGDSNMLSSTSGRASDLAVSSGSSPSAAAEGSAASYPSLSGKRAAGSATAGRSSAEEEERSAAAAAAAAEEGGAMHGAQQLLLLQQEEQQLVESFVQESDIVLDIQRKLQEIIQCMDIFSSKVLEQSAACEFIHEQAEVSVEHVTAAEKHLHLSLQRSAAYRYYIFLFLIGAGFLLLLLDFLKSSSPYF